MEHLNRVDTENLDLSEVEVRPIWQTRHADGSVTVDDFPVYIGIDPNFLTAADSDMVEATVTFRVANGTATYRILGWSREPQCLVCRKE